MPQKGNYTTVKKRVYPYDGRILITLLYAEGIQEPGVKKDPDGLLWVQIDKLGSRTRRPLAEVRAAIDRLVQGGYIYDITKHTSRYYCFRIRNPEEFLAYKQSFRDEAATTINSSAPISAGSASSLGLSATKGSAHG